MGSRISLIEQDRERELRKREREGDVGWRIVIRNFLVPLQNLSFYRQEQNVISPSEPNFISQFKKFSNEAKVKSVKTVLFFQ